jgi:hypothetical protein
MSKSSQGRGGGTPAPSPWLELLDPVSSSGGACSSQRGRPGQDAEILICVRGPSTGLRASRDGADADAPTTATKGKFCEHLGSREAETEQLLQQMC